MIERIERALSNYVVDENGCWLWTKGRNPQGYGRVRVLGEVWRAHRLSYAWHVADLGDCMLVCHRCDVPACINPDHLFLGTSMDNVQDALAKGRPFGRPRKVAC
jgi:hypothetical protein